MNNVKILVLFTFLFGINSKSQAQNMNNESLEKILYVLADSIQGSPGNWRFKINERIFFCLTDENHNRMRIITPIIAEENLFFPELMTLLSANFHTALDVKYALSDKILWSVFIHPLKELSKVQVVDAVQQVYAAAETYGTTYSSTNLIFPNVKKEEPTLKKQ